MNKKHLFLLPLLLLFTIPIFASTISNLSIPSTVRLNEKVSVSGTFDDGNQFILCRFLVYDSSTGFSVDRWSDEYTFSNGTFYAEKVLTEPPYYRGDDFNIVVTCGNAQADGVFTAGQPVSIAQPIQSNWEYFFNQNNLDAGMLFAAMLGAVVIIILSLLFVIKKGGQLAR